MKLYCKYCDYTWDYGGSSAMYATCPRCHYKIKRKESIKREEERWDMTYSAHSLGHCGNSDMIVLVSSIWRKFGNNRFTFGDLSKIDGMSNIRAPTVGKWRRENIIKRTGYEIVSGKKSCITSFPHRQ